MPIFRKGFRLLVITGLPVFIEIIMFCLITMSRSNTHLKQLILSSKWSYCFGVLLMISGIDSTLKCWVIVLLFYAIGVGDCATRALENSKDEDTSRYQESSKYLLFFCCIFNHSFTMSQLCIDGCNCLHLRTTEILNP